MIKQSTWFSFTPPLDWGESNEQGKIVYRSPKGEALIVSSAAVSGHGSESEKQNAQKLLFQNALSSVSGASEQPDLRITRKLSPDDRVLNIACWTCEAETLDGREIFYQSVFQNGMGVLLVTFEGFNSAVAKSEYEAFIKSVQRNN